MGDTTRYFVYRNGSNQTTEVWLGLAPEPGKNIPVDAIVVPVTDIAIDPRNVQLSNKNELIPVIKIEPSISEPSVDELRKAAFDKEMPLGDQLDALSKGLAELLPIILEGAPVTQKTVKMFTPDKDAAQGTPAWWMGKSEDIKKRYPKA